MKSIIVSVCILLCSVVSASAQWCNLHLPASPLSECDYCECSQGLTALEAGGSGIRYEVRSLLLGSKYEGSNSIPNPDNLHESYLTNQFTFFYRFSETPLTAVVNVPYVVRTASDFPEDGGTKIVSPSANGFGDLSLMLRASDQTSWDDALVVLSATAGVKLPTGSTDRQFAGEYMDIDLQPGSGSTDWLAGVGAIWSRERWTFGINALAGFTGTGVRGHRYGNYANADVGARFRLLPDEAASTALFLTFACGGEIRAKETQDGTPIDDSGGSIFFVAPGLRVHFSDVFSFDARAEIPVRQYLNGEQFGQSYRLTGGVQWML